MAVKDRQPEGYNLGALAGIKHERERIIKILTAELENKFGWSSDCDCKECPSLSNLIQKVTEDKND